MRATSFSATRSVTPGMLISRFKLIDDGLDLDGRVAHLPEPGGDERDAVGFELTLDEPAVEVADLVVERGRWHCSVLQARGGAGSSRPQVVAELVRIVAAIEGHCLGDARLPAPPGQDLGPSSACPCAAPVWMRE